jgi:prolyl-tRNA synthetase
MITQQTYLLQVFFICLILINIYINKIDMKLSKFLYKSIKSSSSKEDISKNGQLLIKAGFVNCLMSGVYSYLPIGLAVLERIKSIVREEMNNIDGQELLMPSLTPRTIWDITGRIDTIDVLFKLSGCNNKDLVLAPTHEEIVTPLIQNFVNSYKDLPLSVYQFQTKFRNELRAKSGILRGREFIMKDMYSFHITEDDLNLYYEKVIIAYKNIFKRCGIGDKTILTFASGGAFSKYSHEFQTITNAGEDTVYKVNNNLALNQEIIDDPDVQKEFNIKNKNELETLKTIETGNIFKLGTKYSKAFNFKYTDKDGKVQNPIMGCYGIGITRLMGTIVECLSDEKGLVWPEEIAPFKVHLISLVSKDDNKSKCEEIYNKLLSLGFDVLYDDRQTLSNGEKLNDADLIGIPHRLIVSNKTLAENKIEYKKRTAKESKLLSFDEIIKILK